MKMFQVAIKLLLDELETGTHTCCTKCAALGFMINCVMTFFMATRPDLSDEDQKNMTLALSAMVVGGEWAELKVMMEKMFEGLSTEEVDAVNETATKNRDEYMTLRGKVQ